MCKVSIIVPIYNARNKIISCIETLINQTLKEIEILCIIDCPNDGSDEIITKYAKKDIRIKVINNSKNLHISKSRNIGLQHARGEYIGFSDHDDWRELSMYEDLYRIAKENDADLVISNSFIEKNGKSQLIEYKGLSKKELIASIIQPIMSGKNKNFLSKSVWASLYKRESIIKKNIYFPDRRIYNEEDTLFNLEYILNSKKIIFTNKAYYHWNREIATQSTKKEKNFAESQINLFKAIEEILIKHNVLSEYSEYLKLLISNKIYFFLEYYKNINSETMRILSKLANKYLIFNYVELRKVSMSNITRVLNFLIFKYRLKLISFLDN